MKRLLPLLAGMMVLAPALAGGPAMAATEKMHRVVFDMTSPQPSVWTACLNNVQNLQKRFGAQNTELEVVCHGPGLAMLMKVNKPFEARMDAVAKSGVEFAACNNTMHASEVTKDELFPFVTVVPSGVGELVLKQEEGWAYLKTIL